MKRLTELNISIIVQESKELKPLVYTAEVEYALKGSEFIQTYEFKADATDNLEELIKEVVNKVHELEESNSFGQSRKVPAEEVE